MRKAFNFYRSYHEQLKLLNDKQRLQIYDAICSVQFLEVNINDISFTDKTCTLVWVGVKHSVKASLDGYLYKTSDNKDIEPLAKGGGEAPWQQEKEKEKVQEEVQGKVKEKEKEKILLSQVDESTLNPKDKKYFQVAISFWELVKSNLQELNISGSEVEKAKFKTWINPIRLLMENDGRTIEEFREIFRFLQQDEFWKEQIRSTAKLRKKNKEEITYFEVLLTKSRNEQKRKRNSESKQSGVSEDYKKSIFERLQYSGSSE